jgi:hypothetical protein
MESRTPTATATGARRGGEMWFRWLIVALGALVLAATVLPKLFWWFTITAVALMLAAAVLEMFWDWWQDRALGRPREAETPAEGPGTSPSTEMVEVDK